MNLEQFVKEVLIQINSAVDKARKETSRDIRFIDNDNSRTVEFDIAVTAYKNTMASGKAELKVLELIGAGGKITKENANTTVSRVSFGLQVDSQTTVEKEEVKERIREQKASRKPRATRTKLHV